MSRHLLKRHFGGWNPQLPDHRDRVFEPAFTASSAPLQFELPGIDSIPCIDQGQQGSCTGHGTAGVVMYDQLKQGEPIVIPSRAMIYYDARLPEGTTDQDSGASVRNAVAGVAKWGVCPDSEMPYSDQVFDVAPNYQQHDDAAKQEARSYEATRYPHINATIASGFPIVFGMTVYKSFEGPEVAATGIVPVPAADEQVLGGHCTWMFGYNASDSPWTAPSGRVYPPRTKAIRNSWREPDGTWWGAGGNAFLPQPIFDWKLADDFWVIRRIGPAGS